MKKIDKITTLIFNVSRKMHFNIKNERPEKDLWSMVRLEALRFVSENKNPTMRELADYLSITPPSTTTLISLLIKDKMLKRVEDKVDRRKTRLFITDKGDKYFSDSHRRLNEYMKKSLLILNEKEQKNLISILEKLLGACRQSEKNKENLK
ncbi:MAG TPA: MarR family transcriptional regulator [Candidatus Moranbacteria bacterium]|nr:MarR family transcriptional regulator [Candidatus Moranbacteria bacterium]HQB59512.1 MarR family transcriptional regulator [Candidatus Moranbacteria bacterium]